MTLGNEGAVCFPELVGDRMMIVIELGEEEIHGGILLYRERSLWGTGNAQVRDHGAVAFRFAPRDLCLEGWKFVGESKSQRCARFADHRLGEAIGGDGHGLTETLARIRCGAFPKHPFRREGILDERSAFT